MRKQNLLCYILEIRGVIRGGMGAKPPPWSSEIFGLQEVFKSQRVLSPHPLENNVSAPQTLDYAPENPKLIRFSQKLNKKEVMTENMSMFSFTNSKKYL